MIHLNVTVITMIVGTLLPFLTGIVTKEKSSAFKAIANGLLSGVAGVLTLAITQGGNVSLYGALLSVAIAWGASVLSYHGFWDPTGIVDKVVIWVADKLEKIGIHLPRSEELTVEEWLKTIFGEAIQFLSAEETKVLGGNNPPPPPLAAGDCYICSGPCRVVSSETVSIPEAGTTI